MEKIERPNEREIKRRIERERERERERSSGNGNGSSRGQDVNGPMLKYSRVLGVSRFRCTANVIGLSR